MTWMWLFSLVILAFLIFMITVLLYISKAVKDEINRVQKQLLRQFSFKYARELYQLDDKPIEEAVGKVINLMEDLRRDWDIDVNYNKYKMENKIRNKLK